MKRFLWINTLTVQRSAALVAAMLAIFIQISLHKPVIPVFDSIDYLSVASQLSQTGIFTDGVFKAHAAVTGPHGEGMFFAPLYPVFLSFLMTIDRPFYETAVCIITNPSAAAQCPLNLAFPVFVQGLLAAFSA